MVEAQVVCETKTCTKCGETKPVGEFHKDKKRGYAAACKACDHARSAAYRALHKEQIKEKNARDHRRRGVEHERERHRAWRQNNPERNRQLKARWLAANLEAVRKRKRNAQQEASANLSDTFIKARLRLPVGTEVPQTLIELKRAHLQLYRAIYERN